MLIVERNGEYRRARVNSWRRTAPQIDPDDGRLLQLYRSYRPLHDASWEPFALFPEPPGPRRLAREAWRSPAFEPFRAFARHPVFYSLDSESSLTCVWFTDLRYW